MACIFCQEVKTKASSIVLTSPDGYWVARLDAYPLVPGHIEVLPVRHVVMTYELLPHELKGMEVFTEIAKRSLAVANLVPHYRRMIKNAPDELSQQMITDALRLYDVSRGAPGSYLTAMAEGALAGQSVEHLHKHVIPLTSEWTQTLGLDLTCHVRRLFPNDPYTKRELNK